VDVVRAAVIAGLVLIEVGLWQWRMVVAARGRRTAATLLGTAGAVLQITVISQVVTHVQDPLTISAYAVGVGLGVLLGLVAGDRLTPGHVGVTVITTVDGVARELWARGWPVTVSSGHDELGPVTVLFVTVGRRDEARLHRDVADLDPSAVWSIEDVRPRPAALSGADN
jgi:uncharacterized protein YebE (UPF0316 family)